MGLTDYEKEQSRNKSKLRNQRFNLMKHVLTVYAQYKYNLKYILANIDDFYNNQQSLLEHPTRIYINEVRIMSRVVEKEFSCIITRD